MRKDALATSGGTEVSSCCIVYHDHRLDIACCLASADLKVDTSTPGNGECLSAEAVYCSVTGELTSETCDACNIVTTAKEVSFGRSGADLICSDIFGKTDLTLYLHGEDPLRVDNKLAVLKK